MSFIDRLIAALDDPRTDLVLLLVLWLPTTLVFVVVVAAAVYLVRLLARTSEPSTT
jgi:hypothetical protein